MLKLRPALVTVILLVCLAIGVFCSKRTRTIDPGAVGVFVATSPCDAVLKQLLGISSEVKCDQVNWRLTLYQDSANYNPTSYVLRCVYGLSKQNTRDLMPGAEVIESNGKWVKEKGIRESAGAIVYTLKPGTNSISLSFLNLDRNLLHLLDANKNLMVGNGAFSFTLNRTEVITDQQDIFPNQTSSSPLFESDSSIVGIFDGRTKCYGPLRELNGLSTEGCNATKYRLTLFQDPKNHRPTTFKLLTVYVGKGDRSYVNEGKWNLSKGTRRDPNAVVYELQLDPSRPHLQLKFLKADNNLLFFLDEKKNLSVGDTYFSNTLNRKKN